MSDENKAAEGLWGTRYWGFKINRTLHQTEKLIGQIGFGYARETNTYLTPYNHCFDHPDQPCTKVLKYIDAYSIDLIQTSWTSKYFLSDRFSLNLNVLPQFHFHKKVVGYGTTSDFIFGLYSIEVDPEIEFNAGNIGIALGYRLFQFKTIDKVYLYGNNFLSRNPGYLDRNFDTYNPMKVTLSVCYALGR